MSHEGYSTDFYKGPAFALVIGISAYKHGLEAGMVPEPKQFHHLKFAAKDASDFATFLEKYGIIKYNVRLLINDKATLTEIKDSFEQLRNECERAEANQPLVIVYFAGHGMVDGRDRHYLLPYEAEGPRLHATALSNRELNFYLNELNTNRLVVFLDACHSGGMGDPGARGGVEYDAGRNLGEGTGRWIIASCGKGQRSWEGNGNGIFTRQLLELLSGETEDFDENEEITTNTLYEALKKRVIRAAHEEYQQSQEPIIVSAKETTGIVLAINQRAKRNRINAEEQKKKTFKKVLEAVCDALENTEYKFKTIVIINLRSHFLYDKPRRPGLEYIYAAFIAYASLEDALQRLPEICDNLIDAHEDAMASPRTARKSLDSEPEQSVRDFVGAGDKKVLGSEQRLPPQSTPSVAREQRLFSDAAQKYILGEIIMDQMIYVKHANALASRLAGPVSESDFIGSVRTVTPKDDAEPLHGILKDIETRFGEKWPDAPISKSTSPLDIRSGRGRDKDA